jgi:hypothetical protein
MADWAIVSCIVLSYTGQWLFGLKRVPEPAAWGLIGVLGLVFYWFGQPAPVHVNRQFVQQGILWLFAMKGLGSAFARTPLAPRTNTL